MVIKIVSAKVKLVQCVLDHCDKVPYSQTSGLCKQHYHNKRRNGKSGKPLDRDFKIILPGLPDCKIIENAVPCGRPHNARGMCVMHYMRNRNNGDPLVVMPSGGSSRKMVNKKARPCTVEGCDVNDNYYAKGMCRPHYTRWQITGDPHPKPRTKPVQADFTCEGPECELPAKSDYLCNTHWQQRHGGWRINGELTPLDGSKKIQQELDPRKVDGRICLDCNEYKTWDNYHIGSKRGHTDRIKYQSICKACQLTRNRKSIELRTGKTINQRTPYGPNVRTTGKKK